jgi:hypothetical protein
MPRTRRRDRPIGKRDPMLKGLGSWLSRLGMFPIKHRAHNCLSWLWHYDLLLRTPLISWRYPVISGEPPFDSHTTV